MRKSTKKILALASAAVMASGVLSLAACGNNFPLPSGIPEGNVDSNGGFVVTVGDYYYFINGYEVYSSDNTYGTPVKGSLMRAKKSEETGAWGEAEIVVPSLMVEGSHKGGIFIYGDRVYYATPTNVKGIDGSVQNLYLDFMSAKLDGSDRKDLVRVSSNATDYRFVEAGDTVYLVYYESAASALHSYNTASGKDTVLAEGIEDYRFHKTDKESTTIYYTMTVTDRADSKNPKSYAQFYNQIYRVEVNATTPAHDYEWDREWLNENNEGKDPYVNLGELVLDGIGFNQEKTQFNHSEKTPAVPVGYTYTLRSYENGGVYFTRRQTDMDTVGADDALYYFSEKATAATEWDSIGSNASLDLVANSVHAADKATEDALFYLDDNGGHHYIYVDGDYMYRVDAADDGSIAKEIYIAEGISGATLVSLDEVEEGDEFGYVYYTLSLNSNLTINRAVFDNADHEIEQYYYTSGVKEDGFAWDNYHATAILDLVHASSWYSFEIIGTDLFFADADATAYGSSSLKYVSCVSLANAEGKLMNNAELKAFNEKYEEVTKDLLNDVVEEQGDNLLADAMEYFFYTGDTTLFEENLQEYRDAIEAGEDIDLPYTEEQIAAFEAFASGEFTDGKLSYNGNEYTLKDEDGNSYRTRSYFVTRLGEMNEEDQESYTDHWKKDVLEHYVAPSASEAEALAGWKIALIVVACVIALAAAAAVVCVILVRKHKKANEPKKVRMHVDTTDDRNIDVYADEEPPIPAEELIETYEAPAEAEEIETLEAPEAPEE